MDCRILDVMLNIVSPTNSNLVSYKEYLNITSSGAIPKKVNFQEGTSTDTQVTKKKPKSKPKAFEKEASAKIV